MDILLDSIEILSWKKDLSEWSWVKFINGYNSTHLSFYGFVSSKFRVLIEYFWRSFEIFMHLQKKLWISLGIDKKIVNPRLSHLGQVLTLFTTLLSEKTQNCGNWMIFFFFDQPHLTIDFFNWVVTRKYFYILLCNTGHP